ncbi:reverse transcriptase [Prunus yedoensis var. nudiflora]|uniref:Reverse transcriptase n=1 Tax=Prunus yedoensis var. nudiflora TaxID=2094558 RepID=A0A314UD28_PRUYE|nr:reverse transcriptase [Prunus yedoensis var. nudiflora]
MRGFLHMRVQLDTSRPLQRGFWLPSHKSALSWVKFRYEGLHRFCQRCYRLGHVDKNESMCNHPLCPVVENDGTEFGAWMGTDFVSWSHSSLFCASCKVVSTGGARDIPMGSENGHDGDRIVKRHSREG